MRCPFRSAAAIIRLAAAVLAGTRLFAAELNPPLQNVEHQTHYNTSSRKGLPLSPTVGTPPGSNGKAPFDPPPSPGQFQSLFSLSVGVPKGTPNAKKGSPTNTAPVEISSSGITNRTLLKARVGSPFDNRIPNHSFGSIIHVPVTKADGSAFDSNERAEDYWAEEPYWLAIDPEGYHTNATYHWSPHARAVFATRQGIATIAWRKRTPEAAQPSSGEYATINGLHYLLLTDRSLVSGSAVKQPRRIYWTEGDFEDTGVRVSVPQNLVSEMKFAFSPEFPRDVPANKAIIGSTGLAITNTIYFEQGLIRAANWEGRIFMELLGPRGANATIQHLGFEIIDVFRRPAPLPLEAEIGERITVPGSTPESPGEDDFWPQPVISLSTKLYQHVQGIPGSTRNALYATRETDPSDTAKVWWLEESIGGIRWPRVFAAYTQFWPKDPARYSHYIRPRVTSQTQAMDTAVVLPLENAPFLAYQDDDSHPRAWLNETFAFYSHLTDEYPVHRSLLRFISGTALRFERVLSWLDSAVKDPPSVEAAVKSVGAHEWLDGWDDRAKGYVFPDTTIAPRFVSAPAYVGQRIGAPAGETGSHASEEYLAGHIRSDQGTSYDPESYKDPLLLGFDEAALGAIIPVNAIPGDNELEVWWFRTTHPDANLGFQQIHWPSVIARYELDWPTDAREIVLASNDGTGPLSSLEAKGSVYYQNDRNAAGFNPNEEHALMSGGQAYALRDDLNIVTNTDSHGNLFSSKPFVLVRYQDEDGRPSMTAFQVFREKSDTVFVYQKEAGAILQAPMPLPLMDVPWAQAQAGADTHSLNHEVGAQTVQSFDQAASPVDFDQFVTTDENPFHSFSALSLQPDVTDPKSTSWFYPVIDSREDRRLSGYLIDDRPVWIPSRGIKLSDSPVLIEFRTPSTRFTQWSPGSVAFAADPVGRRSWITEIHSVSTDRLTLQFSGAFDETMLDASEIALRSAGSSDFTGWLLASEPRSTEITQSDLAARHASFTLQDRKGTLWIYRGPHDPADQGTFLMQFHYKTLPGFFFPTRGFDDQPPEGTLTPYLREPLENGSGYYGDPVQADANADGISDGQSLAVTYHPHWPGTAPVLQMAESLMLPKRGLPAIRGQTSMEVVYQQSQVHGIANASVALHDPTREKVFELAAPDGSTGLNAIPDSVKTQSSRGKTYFPNLPPHLGQRFFFDPDRGVNGALVLRGEFVDEPVGEKYLLLNVLGEGDTLALQNLCDSADKRYQDWTRAITQGLTTTLETFEPNMAKPGTFVPRNPLSIGPAQLSEITDDDIAVDSYALTATGPGTGYVTLIAGNGRAFTPTDEPTSLHIIKVVSDLHRGEVKVILPDNPLSERVTLQQTVDLAGLAEDFRFEWKIASPVDGLPPVVYENTRRLLLGDGSWKHLPFPLETDSPGSLSGISSRRFGADIRGGLVPVQNIPFDPSSVTHSLVAGVTRVRLKPLDNYDRLLSPGVRIILRDHQGNESVATVDSSTFVERTLDDIQGITGRISLLIKKPNPSANPSEKQEADLNQITQIYEAPTATSPRSAILREFTTPRETPYTSIYLSLDLDAALGADVYWNGVLVASVHRGASDTPTVSAPADFLSLSKVYRLGPEILSSGIPDTANNTLEHTLVAYLYSQANADVVQTFDLRIEAYESVDRTEEGWLPLPAEKYPDGIRAILGGTADVRSLADNYLIMRYQAKDSSHASFLDKDGDGKNDIWSSWTTPQLAEGWIKRVLAGINPFNQRVTDLFNHRVNTDVSLLTQAGPRWEGDVALNFEAINNSGLIEIYETILRRGRILSIDGHINYGPANDALLLVSGYLNDLYALLGNEAWADASNPTIGIGTKDKTYGDIATALFAFKGQVPSLLEEELALLRGRDDFLQPGVETPPVYNRLFWNYTRGIDSGEVVYAINYNIQEDSTRGSDGAVDALDALRLYPQGHGDAYGHYLTALKGYYSLLLDQDFDWVPRTEAVTILGKPVQVDYLDERKFAASAAALARTGKQIFDLTWRRDFEPANDSGWDIFGQTRSNTRRTQTSTRFWGMDHWASRTGIGSYVNWVVGNAILPDVDPDPSHEGIQKIDRNSVPELLEIPAIMQDLQSSLENAEAHLTPLAVPTGALAFDINPNRIVGGENETHFEQIYSRALAALKNALTAFDDAKDVTRLMRSEEDSLAEFRAQVEQQELAFNHSLIEIYGTPYPDDIGPGKTYPTGFVGPDLIHYDYVDVAELNTPLFPTDVPSEVRLDIQLFPDDYLARLFASPDWIVFSDAAGGHSLENAMAVNPLNPDLRPYLEGIQYVSYTIQPHGFFGKPSHWQSRRASPGQIQQAISEVIRAQNWAGSAFADADWAKWDLDKAIQVFNESENLYRRQRSHTKDILDQRRDLSASVFSTDLALAALDTIQQYLTDLNSIDDEAIPDSTIAGTAFGGDLTFAVRASLQTAINIAKSPFQLSRSLLGTTVRSLQFAQEQVEIYDEYNNSQPWEHAFENQQAVVDIGAKLSTLQGMIFPINSRLQELDDARRNHKSLVAKGNRLQEEREVYRKRAAAVIQGYRTRDAGFRIFRNEKLERYKSLFDLAARYTYLAAKAYDYETGLLDSDQGRRFLNRVIAARALGVVKDGQPQFAGSNTGDPGLSSILAEMKADWDVLKGRLGFNNPDAYGTTASLRTENFRILAEQEGDTAWRDVLARARMDDIRMDSDVRRYCMQVGSAGDEPIPGIVLTFATSIADGLNLFGQPLVGGDHAFSPTAFATKVFGVGVAFEGYEGMDNPSANATALASAGASSPGEPTLHAFNPNALSANPYIYLIPVGVDSMRTPPLGDASTIRTWSVDDVTIPLPFNIGASEFSSKKLFQASDSLSEPLFSTRKHQAFRPVSTVSSFSGDLYGGSGQLKPSQYTNRRLIGRSVWNSQWKLIIPGRTLLNNPQEGLDRFIQSVTDVKLHFVTYSYSGN